MLRINALIVGILSFTSSIALAAEQDRSSIVSAGSTEKVCGWLPTAQVDVLAPSLAPWHVSDGGAAGLCVFASAHDPQRTLSLIQMFQESTVAASDYVRDLNGMMKDKLVIKRNSLGEHAYLIRREVSRNRLSIHWTAHKGPLVLTATLNTRDDIPDASVAEIEEVINAALVNSQGDEIRKSAATCPLISERLAKKILTNADFYIRRAGDSNCFAADASKSSIFVSMRKTGDIELTMDSLRRLAIQNSCEISDLPSLGPYAFISSGCKSAMHVARIHFSDHDQLADVAFAYAQAGHFVTQAQKTALVENAEFFYQTWVPLENRPAVDAKEAGTLNNALQFSKQAYRLTLTGSFGDSRSKVCVTDETNSLLSPEGWQAHFAKLGTKCDLSDINSSNRNALSWKGHCSSPVLGKIVITENEVRINLLPATKGFLMSIVSTGDFKGTVSIEGETAGKCKPEMPVYKPWG